METLDHILRQPDGHTLRATEGGDPEGWPIIVPHGTPLSGRLYGPHLAYARERGIRLIGYDRPGYGGSDPRPGRTVAQAADDVGFIADRLGLTKFAVWGHSGGGSHALACASRLTGRVTAVVASATLAPYGAHGLDWLAGMGRANVEEFRAALGGRDSIERFLQRRRLEGQAKKDAVPPDLLTLLSPEDFGILAGELGPYLEAATEDGLAPGLVGWIDDDLAHASPWGFELKRAEVPTAIWHGKRDRFVPYSHSVWLAHHLPGAELRLFDDETHLTLFHRRAPEVLDWLQRRRPNR